MFFIREGRERIFGKGVFDLALEWIVEDLIVEEIKYSLFLERSV